jgi:hypothetical protein
LIVNQKIQDPFWLAGFTSGEGCFYIGVSKHVRSKLGETVGLAFSIAQDNRDKVLLQSFMSYLECGYWKEAKNRSWGDFYVSAFSDIHEKIIPFFRDYKILGVKSQDFEDWCKVAEIMVNKGHLTQEGLDEIKKIKAGMNSQRIFE